MTAEEIPLRSAAACGDGSTRSIPSASLQEGTLFPRVASPSPAGGGTGDEGRGMGVLIAILYEEGWLCGRL